MNCSFQVNKLAIKATATLPTWSIFHTEPLAMGVQYCMEEAEVILKYHQLFLLERIVTASTVLSSVVANYFLSNTKDGGFSLASLCGKSP